MRLCWKWWWCVRDEKGTGVYEENVGVRGYSTGGGEA